MIFSFIKINNISGIRIDRLYFLFIAYFFLGITLHFSIFTVRKDLQDHDLSLAKIASVTSFLYLPWVFKPVYGFISDRYTLYKKLHRRPYIILSNLICSVLSFCVLLPHNATSYIFTLFFIQVFATFADVVMDAMMVEESMFEPANNKGHLQTLTWRFRYIGLAGSIMLGAKIYEEYGSTVIFTIQGFIYLFQAFLATLTFERGEEDASIPKIAALDEDGTETVVTTPKDPGYTPEYMKRKELNLCQHLKLVFKCLLNPHVGKILLFNFLRDIKPTADLAMFFYLLDVLNFTPTMMGTIGFVAELVKFLTIGIFHKWLRPFKIRTLVTWSFVGIVLVSFLLPLVILDYVNKLHISVFTLFIFMDSIDNALDEVIILPLLISTTFTSDRDVSGTVYSANLAVSNLAGTLNGFIDAILMHYFRVNHGKFENLLSLTLLNATLNLILIQIVFLVPDTNLEDLATKFDKEQKENEKKQKEEVVK